MADLKKVISRANVDNAIRALWLAFRDFSDDYPEKLTESDLHLWGLVTSHKAVQGRLEKVKKSS